MFGAGAFFASGAATAFAAIDKTRLLDVTLIGALQPVVIIVIAVLFLGEPRTAPPRRAGVRRGPATVLVASSTSGSGSWSMAGEMLAVLSLFLNAGWYLYGRVLRGRYAIDPFGFMLGVLAAAAVLMTPIAILSAGTLRMSGSAYFWVTATMVFGTAAHLLLVWAHRYVPASLSAPFLLAEPPLVAIGAWVFFGEALTAGRDLRVARCRRRALGHGPQPCRNPRRGRRAGPRPAHLRRSARRSCGLLAAQPPYRAANPTGHANGSRSPSSGGRAPVDHGLRGCTLPKHAHAEVTNREVRCERFARDSELLRG